MEQRGSGDYRQVTAICMMYGWGFKKEETVNMLGILVGFGSGRQHSAPCMIYYHHIIISDILELGGDWRPDMCFSGYLHVACNVVAWHFELANDDISWGDVVVPVAPATQELEALATQTNATPASLGSLHSSTSKPAPKAQAYNRPDRRRLARNSTTFFHSLRESNCIVRERSSVTWCLLLLLPASLSEYHTRDDLVSLPSPLLRPSHHFHTSAVDCQHPTRGSGAARILATCTCVPHSHKHAMAHSERDSPREGQQHLRHQHSASSDQGIRALVPM